MPCRVRLFDVRRVADAGPHPGFRVPEPAEDGGPLMAWGTPISEELAAREAARVAQERAATRARMTPWEQQNLTALAEIGAALTVIAAALQTLQTPPRGEGSSAPGIADDHTESTTPQVDSIQLAGGRELDSTPTGEHPTT